MSDTQGCNACVEDSTVVNHDFNTAFATKMKTEQPAFIVNGGDLSNYGNRSYMFLDDVLSQWNATDIANMPIYAIVGNHELVRAALGNYIKEQQTDLPGWWKSHYFDKGGPAWPQNGGPAYSNLAFSFRYGNAMFILTDTFYMWGANGNDSHTNGDMMYQGLDLRQLAFVDHEGRDAKTLGLSHAFVFGHSHLWPTTSSGDSSVEFSNWYREDLAEIMANNTVFDGYFTGHSGKLDISGTGTSPTGANRVHQLIAEAGSGEINPNYYLRVEVTGKTVTVIPVSYDRNAKVWADVTAQKVTWTQP